MSKSRYVPRRGDFIWMNFSPHAGHEQAEERPALVLSPVEYNRQSGMAVVCPTTNHPKGYPWEVLIPENPYISGAVLADQVKNVDWRARRARFLYTPDDESILDEVVDKAIALIDPEEEE